MAFTLKIVFIGLVAFAPADDGGIVLLTQGNGDHAPLIIQRTGKCAPVTGGTCEWPFPQLNSERLFWLPHGLEIEIQTEGANQPLDTSELTDLVNVGKNVPGPGPLRPSCRGKAYDCDIWTRLRIHEGTLSTCHRLHIPVLCANDGGEVLQYVVGGEEQRVADAFTLTVSVTAVDLIARDLDGSEEDAPLNRVQLVPDGDEVVLYVVNENLSSWQCGGPPDCQPPHNLGHFVSYHQMINPLWIFGRMSKKAPRLSDRRLLPQLHACEDRLADFQYWLCNQRTFLDRGKYYNNPSGYPHGGTECENAAFGP